MNVFCRSFRVEQRVVNGLCPINGETNQLINKNAGRIKKSRWRL